MQLSNMPYLECTIERCVILRDIAISYESSEVDERGLSQMV